MYFKKTNLIFSLLLSCIFFKSYAQSTDLIQNKNVYDNKYINYVKDISHLDNNQEDTNNLKRVNEDSNRVQVIAEADSSTSKVDFLAENKSRSDHANNLDKAESVLIKSNSSNKKQINEEERNYNSNHNAEFSLDNEVKKNKKFNITGMAVFFFLFFSASAILVMVYKRLLKDKNVKNKGKLMEIISSISLSSKRQILLVRVRNKEIILTSTENGIDFVSEKRLKNKTKKTAINSRNIIKDEIKMIENLKINVENNSVKSDKIMNKFNKDEIEKPINRLENNYNKVKIKNNTFPKYLAETFSNEAKKDITKDDIKENNESIENVTNLIREKLRSMKPLN